MINSQAMNNSSGKKSRGEIVNANFFQYKYVNPYENI